MADDLLVISVIRPLGFQSQKEILEDIKKKQSKKVNFSFDSKPPVEDMSPEFKNVELP
jgi:hypothetical protein